MIKVIWHHTHSINIIWNRTHIVSDTYGITQDNYQHYIELKAIISKSYAITTHNINK